MNYSKLLVDKIGINSDLSVLRMQEQRFFTIMYSDISLLFINNKKGILSETGIYLFLY